MHYVLLDVLVVQRLTSLFALLLHFVSGDGCEPTCSSSGSSIPATLYKLSTSSVSSAISATSATSSTSATSTSATSSTRLHHLLRLHLLRLHHLPRLDYLPRPHHLQWLAPHNPYSKSPEKGHQPNTNLGRSGWRKKSKRRRKEVAQLQKEKLKIKRAQLRK